MATDVAAQRVDVIAKDILIAALQAGLITLNGPAENRGAELGKAYIALIKGIRAPAN